MAEQDHVDEEAEAARGPEGAIQDAPEAPVSYERQIELETGPLLPRWLSLCVYGVFIPWCLFSAVWIARAMSVQHRTFGAVKRICGPWEGEPHALDSDQIEHDFAVLEIKSRSSLLYLIQEIRQEERKDPRMALAYALRRTVRWGTEAKRRELFAELLSNMGKEGDMDPDYALPAGHADMLAEFVGERKALGSVSYEEQKITEVLEWIADGRPTPAKGPERRRVAALKTGAEKKLFFGREKRALARVIEDWRAADVPVRSSAAEKFGLMLAAESTELTPEEAALCNQVADEQEESFKLGRTRLADSCLRLVKTIEEQSKAREAAGGGPLRVDHPVVWDIVRFLDHPYKEVRDPFAKACLVLMKRKYVVIHLSDFIRRKDVNPVMAVETTRLTKSDHERELRHELQRRRLASIGVLKDIGVAYYTEPFNVQGVEPDKQRAFIDQRVIGALESVLDDRDGEVAALAQHALDEVRAARRTAEGDAGDGGP